MASNDYSNRRDLSSDAEEVRAQRAITETGTGGAYAKLSGGQKPCPPLALLTLSG
ncbi:hypothetical protein [Candidatus Binatus sp.]|uniref:hypothetical protein n=1 Tax=Candidatus Binatus sp. TaxID=2811406 RepID=UPI003C575E3D